MKKQRNKRKGLIVLLLASLLLVLSLVFGVLMARGLLSQKKMPALLRAWIGQPGQTPEHTPPQPQPTATTAPSLPAEPTATPRPTQAPQPTAAPQPTQAPSPLPTQAPPKPTAAPDPYTALEEAYLKASPAVVGIQVEVPASGSQPLRTNEGSGLLIDRDGVVVTQATLIDLALNRQGQLLPDARIELSVPGSERLYTGEIVGRDRTTDVAVIRLKDVTKPLKTLPLYRGRSLQAGQMVLALGYPDLLEAAGGLSIGYITALDHRLILEDGTEVEMIKADLAMQQRSAGGPLLNVSGHVIGLTACGITGEPYSSQIHALSIGAVLAVADRLLEAAEQDEQTWLGVAVLNTERFAELQNLYAYPDGLLIANVTADSPAYIADLRQGDILTAINGQAMPDVDELRDLLDAQPVGAALDIELYRTSEDRQVFTRAYLQAREP